MFSLHSLIENALVNNDDTLVNVIKQSLNLKFVKRKKVRQDYFLKLVQEKKLLEILRQKNLSWCCWWNQKGKYFCFNISKSIFR